MKVENWVKPTLQGIVIICIGIGMLLLALNHPTREMILLYPFLFFCILGFDGLYEGFKQGGYLLKETILNLSLILIIPFLFALFYYRESFGPSGINWMGYIFVLPASLIYLGCFMIYFSTFVTRHQTRNGWRHAWVAFLLWAAISLIEHIQLMMLTIHDDRFKYIPQILLSGGVISVIAAVKAFRERNKSAPPLPQSE